MSTVAWIVPSLIEGSGGHRTILQNAEYLQNQGYATTLYLENDANFKPWESPGEAIYRLFGYRFPDVRIGWHEVQPADLVFATIWYSAKLVRDLPFACRKLYFIQDWEACFNPMGDTYLMAENSYRYGLMPILIGNWLRHELKSRYGINGMSFDFCADTAIYHPLPNPRREKAICFIYQPEKPRRGPLLGIEALGIVKHVMPEVKIYLYGSKQSAPAWFEHESLGLLKLDDCNSLYNRAMVGLCISSSNPSRVPFEMMASGLPVVELHRHNTLYDLPEEACLLCDQAPESLAEGLIRLLGDEPRRQAMSAAGARFMAGKTIENGMRQFHEAVRWVESHPPKTPMPTTRVESLYTRAPVTAGPYLETLPAGVVRAGATKLAARRRPGLFKRIFRTRKP